MHFFSTLRYGIKQPSDQRVGIIDEREQNDLLPDKNILVIGFSSNRV